MLDLKIAKKLIGKLTSMPMTPPEKEAVALRAEALSKYARSQNHAERVTTAILERESYFPTVALIVQECETTPDDAQMQALRKDCPYCNGDGMRIVNGPYETSAAYSCNHTAEGNPRMGVPIPPVVESQYKREGREIETNVALHNKHSDPRKFMRRASVPQCVLDVIR